MGAAALSAGYHLVDSQTAVHHVALVQVNPIRHVLPRIPAVGHDVARPVGRVVDGSRWTEGPLDIAEMEAKKKHRLGQCFCELHLTRWVQKLLLVAYRLLGSLLPLGPLQLPSNL